MGKINEKTCPCCGAPLPEEAAFCPHCAKSINRRSKNKPPRPFPARLLQRLLLCCLAAVLALGIWFRISPKTYDGMGEITYTDSDGTYQLLSNVSSDRYYPMTEIHQDAGDQESYRFPLRLYINHRDTGADAGGMFLQKVESAELEIRQPGQSPKPVTASQPFSSDDIPGAALVSSIDFSRLSAGPIELVWVLHMDNSDTIRIRSNLVITPVRTYQYDAGNADLSDSQALQALIDRLAEETGRKDTVNIELPPVTYEEPITLHSRAFNLTGTQSGDQRTTFTAGILVEAPDEADDWISRITGIDFIGSGSGIAVSASNRVRTQNCYFSNWKTALLAYGNAWINTMDCVFEDNETGLYYNVTGGLHDDNRFTGNTFRSNQTAVVLENVATDVRMDFGGCLFEGNQTDIDNRCNQSVNIQEAIFQ